MTSQSDEEPPDDYRKFEIFYFYLEKIMKSLPLFTGQIVLIFCVLPISFGFAVFLTTAVFNFGLAFIAQTISTLLILLVLIPSLAVAVVSAIATAYILQISQLIFLRISNNTTMTMERQKAITSGAPKMEIEEKLKIS